MKLNFAGVIRSEWIKLRSLRSTWWTLGSMAVTVVGMVVMVTLNMRTSIEVGSPDSPADMAEAPSETLPDFIGTLAGVMGAVFLVALAILAITGEYSSGSIRSTLTAAPRRTAVLGAKAVAVGLVAAVAATIVTALATAVGGLIYSIRGIDIQIDGEGWRMIAGVPLYAIGISLFALGLGVLLRSSAGGITLTLGVMFVLPSLMELLPAALSELSRWLPAQAGSQLLLPEQPSDIGGPWGGLAILAGWAVLALAGGAISFNRRDA